VVGVAASSRSPGDSKTEGCELFAEAIFIDTDESSALISAKSAKFGTVSSLAIMAEVMEMKCTMKKPVSFYIKSAQAFLKGVDAVEAKDGKEAKEAKPPVDEMKISGLGEAINAAVSSAVRAEAEGLATITSVQTLYPEMTSGRGCAQIVLTLKKK